jgi:hypothetical protein
MKMVEMFEVTEDDVFKRAYEIVESLRKYIKEKHENNPAISVLHALAILYIHYYREISEKGTDADKEHALMSLKSILDMIVEYGGEIEWLKHS